VKARIRSKVFKSKLTGAALQKFHAKHKISSRIYRDNKRKRLINNNNSASFKSRQSFGKALKKVTSSLPKCDKKKKVIVQHLAQTFGLIPKTTHHRTSIQLTNKLKKDIHNFYVRDDVSYQCPGKRDTVVVKEDDGTKTSYQKRILINNLRESYELFKEENKNVDLSRSAFADLRPPFVVPKAALTHRICVCKYHENTNLLLKSLEKCVTGKVCSCLKTFTEALVCNSENQECMFSQCPLCDSFFHERVEQKVIDGSLQIKWFQWVNENGKAEKKEFSGSVDQALQLLQSKVEYFKFHVYVKRAQSKNFEKLKSEVTLKKIVCQVDFSANWEMKEQDETQSGYWNSKSLSVFTAYVWSESGGVAFSLPSQDLTHDKFVVNSALELIINHVKTLFPDLEEVDFFSDGAASQFKQRFHFRNIIQLASNFKIHLRWHFFATSHGKGTVDAIGGSVKRVVSSVVLGGEACRSAADFVKIANKKCVSITSIEIKKTDIDNSKLKLENLFKTTKQVPETLKTHFVKVIDQNSIETRYYLEGSAKHLIKF
ncbi:unnamed protein product, partial [Didymodactylos carnosus]